MEITTVDSLNTELGDRTLWYDGDSTITEESLMRMVALGKSTVGVFVSEITEDIAKYNRYVDKEKRLGIKKDIRPLLYDWNIPDEYKTIDVMKYVATKLMEQEQLITDELWSRAGRVADELNLYKKLDLMDVLRTLIFVINTLIENNVVWGVGRGSSVASYVLYLIGVHDVDSFKYGLNIEEFLRAE